MALFVAVGVRAGKDCIIVDTNRFAYSSEVTANKLSLSKVGADKSLGTVTENGIARTSPISDKLKLGLIINRRFHEENRWCSATTFHLVEALKSRFDCVYIQNQQDYESKLGDVDLLISMEPGWAAPVLELSRTEALRERLSAIPSYIFYSDPHANKWRQEYFLKNGLDYVLAFYYAPFRYHFTEIQPDRLIHFPWAIPDRWMSDSPIVYQGQRKICCFGGQKGEAYEVRNWCRGFEFVESATNSGVENKVMSESEYIDWLKTKDASIAAGSDSPKYKLTVPKYFEIAAAGSLLFAQQTDDLALLGFEHRRNCVIFDRYNFEQLAREYLMDSGSYLQIRQAGRELIRQRHSLSQRMNFLSKHVEQACLLKHRKKVCKVVPGKTDFPAQSEAVTANQAFDILSPQENREFEFWFERICVPPIVNKARHGQLLWQGRPLEWDAAYEILAYHEFCGGSVPLEQLLFMSNNRYQLLDQIWPKGPLSKEKVETFYQASTKILPWGHGVFIADHQTEKRRKTWLRRVRLLTMLKERQVESVCDYGAGGGHTSLLARAMNFRRVVHHEYSIFHPYIIWRTERMTAAQQSKSQLEFSAAENPLSLSEPVDAIICTDVAEHVWDPIKMLEEIRRALKPDGFLVWCSYFGEGLSCHLHPDLKGKEENILRQTGFERIGDLPVSFNGHSGLYQAVPVESHGQKDKNDTKRNNPSLVLTPHQKPPVHKMVPTSNPAQKVIEQKQWLSRVEIEQHQWRDIMSLLEHSYKNVPFYSRRFDSIGITPRDIRSMDDFRKIPILKKADIQQNLEKMRAINCPADQLLRDATGGSTGEPLVFYRDLNAHSLLQFGFLRFRRGWMGYGPENKLALIWGADRDFPKKYPPNERWLNSFNCSESDIERFVEELVQWKPDAIRAYATSLYMVASFIKQRGLKPPRPKVIESSAEKLWPWQREIAEEVFECKVFEQYGSRELPVLACECECHNGMHIFSDLRLIEIIKDGKPAKPGEEGSIIITDLINYGMPFIRYEIGDVGIISQEHCACGRGFPLLKEVKGRITSTIRTPDGKLIHGEYFTHLFYNVAGIKAFQVHQTKLNEIIVSVQPDVNFNRDLIEQVVKKMRFGLGNGVHIEWKTVDEIPKTATGKRHFTISDVPVNFADESDGSRDAQTAIGIANNQSYDRPKKRAGKKILFIVDSPGWAHDFKTNNIIRRLGDSYDITKVYGNQVTVENIENSDLVLIYYWYELRDFNIDNILDVLIKNKHKLLFGICSHHEMMGKNRESGLKFLRHLASGIFVNSMILYKEFAHFFDVPVFYTPNGVDTEFYSPAPDKRTGEKLRIGWAGSIRNHGKKRGYHEYIVPAVNSVSGVELMTAAREEKLRGPEEMREFYRSLDAYICASITEGTPNPCLEAAACGIPLVTTAVGNMPELIKDGQNGFFIERDVNDIANKLKLLRDNPQLREQLSRGILESIKQWDWAGQAENYRKMFEQMLSAKGHPESNKNRLVSVIMPVYNGQKYLSEAIESVLAQDYRNLELVVINDGSTDRTEEIVFSFKDERIRCFKQENRGLAASHNEGIKKSRGEFLIKVDADDFIAVDFIGKHLDEFYSHRDVDLVYCDDCLVEEDGKPIRIIKRPEYTDRRILIRDLFRAGFPVVPFRTCIQRRVFEKIGLFDESLRIGEDYDMMKRFVKAGLKAHHLKEALYFRRLAPESLSRKYSTDKARQQFEIIRSYAEAFNYDELFPDVQWEQIPAGMRDLHFKCLAAMNFISLGQTYIESNLPNYAGAALECAGEQLRKCLEIDPGNGEVRKLMSRCQRLEESLYQMV